MNYGGNLNPNGLNFATLRKNAMYSINSQGNLILTILHDNNDLDYCLVNGEIIVKDEVSGEVEAV